MFFLSLINTSFVSDIKKKKNNQTLMSLYMIITKAIGCRDFLGKRSFYG